MTKQTDKYIGGFDTSAASRKGSPYARYPERETYKGFKFYRREDGTRYVKIVEVSRWGGTYAAPIDLETKEVADGQYPEYV